MQPKINKDACIGCGICPAVCPQVFAMNQEGDKAVVLPHSSYNQFGKPIEEAISVCPTNAISQE